METRIYVVIQNDKPHRLVEATSSAQAVRHCAKSEYDVAVARPKDLARLMANGISVEKVTDETAITN